MRQESRGRRRMLPVLLVASAWPAIPASAQQGAAAVSVVNRTGEEIGALYATPPSVRDWGFDRLGASGIPAGATRTVRLPADGNCTYDVRVVLRSGALAERRGLDLCASRSVTFGPGDAVETPAPGPAPGGAVPAAPALTLVNRSGMAISEVYVSPTGVASWGYDLLGPYVLAPGQSVPVRMAPGPCLFDLRVVYANRAVQERRQIDACRQGVEQSFP
ncbi:hypothetical protein M0638_22385 [Roseomonas sp. NAR14]|uniref:P pilus assembly chaperone PapD n=1 Tax=Roseomonas acroporae TaxID=2937791 RepID=A0A9X1YJ74_9PROT|nr:hypothetical protein [Roseomonas acroporae]MCK8787126.1 hypothetical protein [Roseomonas acroporae]